MKSNHDTKLVKARSTNAFAELADRAHKSQDQNHPHHDLVGLVSQLTRSFNFALSFFLI